MTKLDKYWLGQVDTAVRMTDEKRRDLHMMQMSGKNITLMDLSNYIHASDELLKLLKDYWPAIKNLVEHELA